MSELELYKSTGLTPSDINELKNNYELACIMLYQIELNRAVNSLSLGKLEYQIGEKIYKKRDYHFLISEIKKITQYIQDKKSSNLKYVGCFNYGYEKNNSRLLNIQY